MPRQIAHDYPASHRVAYESYVPPLKLFDNRGQVVGKRIEIISPVRFARTPVAPAVVRDAANSRARKPIDLIFPPSRIQRPRSGKDHGLSSTRIPEKQICTV